jgi:hypothetical protein
MSWIGLSTSVKSLFEKIGCTPTKAGLGLQLAPMTPKTFFEYSGTYVQLFVHPARPSH